MIYIVKDMKFEGVFLVRMFDKGMPSNYNNYYAIPMVKW